MTTETDALLAYACEHKPGLLEALTRECQSRYHGRGWRPRTVCLACGRQYERGHIQLPAAEAHVALEEWLNQNGHIFGRGGYDPSFWNAWWVEIEGKQGEGDTLAGAVLAALEAK